MTNLPTDPNELDYMPLAEVCRRLGIDAKTARKAIRAGTLPGGIRITERCYRVLRVPFEDAMHRGVGTPNVTFLHRRKAS